MTMNLTTGTKSLDITFGIMGFLLILLFIRRTRRMPKGLRLPPGPRGNLVIGNVTDMPTHHHWEKFTQWAKEYGNLVHIEVFGQHIVSVNSADVAHDLFERKSSIYSDRGDFPMLKLIGMGWNFAIMRHGERWRRHRKAFHQHFRSAATTAYHDIQAKHIRDLLRRLQESPNDFIEHLRHLAGAIIMEAVYGIQVLPTGDPYIEIAEKAAIAAAETGSPGAFLVDMFPFLKHVPEWMPGAGFQTKARNWRVPVTEMATLPFMAVKESLTAGTAKPSVTASLLEEICDGANAPAEEEIIRNVAVTTYLAGSDTTVSSLTSFMLAMVLYPEVQRKAQSELDSVIGMDRLPTFEDRESLPYVNALCKELLRCYPVFPLGVPHWVTEDDVYGDYFIPGGSIVIGNAWAMLHDEKMYGSEPEKFKPERFLKPGVNDPTPAFGFGRRKCPGRHMADKSIFIAVASILKVFNISLARDSQGNEIPVAGTFTPGLATHPAPFKCSIKPRPMPAFKA